MTAPDERAALVSLLRSTPRGWGWNDVAKELLYIGSAVKAWRDEIADRLGDADVADGTLFEADPKNHANAQALQDTYNEALDDVHAWDAAGLRMLTILDRAYPDRIREIHQAPPFLFAAGELLDDDPAIAVVGSRKASANGIKIATTIATHLAHEGITVLSGLAAGIDTAAHTAALAAGGRTVALIGTGILRHYPAANRDLQNQIAERGLLLSQFWPDGPPRSHHFLMRNAVMSGYGRATVVVEAGENSGARAQARMAVEHGRPVVLTDDVVAKNQWAQRLEGRPGVHVARSADEVMAYVHGFLARESRVEGVLASLRGGVL